MISLHLEYPYQRLLEFRSSINYFSTNINKNYYPFEIRTVQFEQLIYLNFRMPAIYMGLGIGGGYALNSVKTYNLTFTRDVTYEIKDSFFILVSGKFDFLIYQDFWIGSELNYLLWKPNFTLKGNEYNGLPFEEDLDLSALFFLLELNTDLILTKSGV